MLKKIKIILMITINMLIFTMGVNGQSVETNLKKRAGKGQKLSVVLLPIDNFSSSSMKYLETYIPELLEKRLKSTYKDMDATTLFFPLNREGEYQYSSTDKVNSKYFLNSQRELNKRNHRPDYILGGRYIIHEKSLKIDLTLYETKNRRVQSTRTFNVKITDQFLETLKVHIGQIQRWVGGELNRDGKLTPMVSREAEGESLLGGYYKRIISTKAGRFVQNKWILSVILLVLFYLLSKFIAFIFQRVLLKIAAKTKTDVDTQIIKLIRKPVKWSIIFLGIILALASLNIKSHHMALVTNIFVSLIICLVIYMVVNMVNIIIRAWGHRLAARINSRINEDLIPLFINISRVVIISVGMLVILSRFNIDIAPLIASLGIVGFAIGFAVKDSLSNIIGGIILILDQSFAVGDKVTIDSDTGIIKEVGLRNTRLQTFDNEIIVIPNGELMNKKFKNYVLPDPMIRVVVDFTVAYGTDVDRVESVIMEALYTIDDIAEDPGPAVVFVEMADFSLNFQAKLWIPDYVNQYMKKIETLKVVYKALVKAGIEIPFPTHTVYLEKS